MKLKKFNYKMLRTEIFFLIIALSIVIISFIASLFDDEYLWFARSGSIMVLFAVIVEYKLNNKTLKSINKKVSASVTYKTPISLLNNTQHKYVSIIAHIFVVLGTLIWGYGDLINK